MLNSTVLTAKDIKEIANLKGKEKGIDLTHIEINKGIKFSGKIKMKVNGNFNGIVYIREVVNNKIILELKDLRVTSFGILKGVPNIMLKAIIKVFGEDYLDIKGNSIIINLEKVNRNSIIYNTSITDVYINDSSLYIIGTNLDMYLNA